ncbi:MAG: TrkH family potassium uptake protein [Verrucomicrobiota bacterium]
MNFRFVSLTLGGVLLIECLMMSVCWLYSSIIEATTYPGIPSTWMTVILITLTIAIIFMLYGRKADRDAIFRREALAVVGLSWLLCGIFGALPFMMNPVNLSISDSLFESYSGFTTTGATIMKEIGDLPNSYILWRSLMQWMGGMGIVVLFVALLGFLGVGGKVLFQGETSVLAEGDLRPRIQSLSFSYLIIYFAMTGVACVGLLLLGMNLFDAVNHSLTSISTGGFSPKDSSIAFYNSTGISLWLIVIMIIGGVAFPTHYKVLILKQFHVLRKNEETRIYFWILGISIFVITLLLVFRSSYAWENAHIALLEASFTVVAIMTSSGFAITDFDQWPPFAKLILLCLMVIGGCAGSTTGGVKVARFIVFAKEVIRQLRLVYRPRLIQRLRLNGRVVSDSVIAAVTFYFALYFILMTLGIFVLALLQPGLEITTTVSAVFASLNNIGPGLEDVGPTQNYHFFNAASKIWLSLLMLLGRLEIYAIILLFIPGFWRKY